MPDKAEQSRINGAKSHGPITDEGKEKVSQNATKHGGYSYRVVIRGESEEIYKQIYLAYWAEYKPETPSEADAVEDIINTRWKIRRFETIESNYFAIADTLYQDHPEYNDQTPDTQQRACFNHLIETQPGFEACAKFLERYQRANARALRNLDRIRKAAGKPKLETSPSEVEKHYPVNTTPQPPDIPKKEPIATINPDPPKREQGKAVVEILLFLLLTLTAITQTCQPIKKEGSILKLTPSNQLSTQKIRRNRGWRTLNTSRPPTPSKPASHNSNQFTTCNPQRH